VPALSLFGVVHDRVAALHRVLRALVPARLDVRHVSGAFTSLSAMRIVLICHLAPGFAVPEVALNVWVSVSPYGVDSPRVVAAVVGYHVILVASTASIGDANLHALKVRDFAFLMLLPAGLVIAVNGTFSWHYRKRSVCHWDEGEYQQKHVVMIVSDSLN